MTVVEDHPERGRYELPEEGGASFADYAVSGDVVAILHVETPPALRGRGAAARLMEGVCALEAARGRRIRPVCGYAAAWFRRHPDARALLAP